MNTPAPPVSTEKDPKIEEMDTVFRENVRRLLAVPKKDIDASIAAEKAERKRQNVRK